LFLKSRVKIKVKKYRVKIKDESILIINSLKKKVLIEKHMNN